MIANPTWIGANTAVSYHIESKDNYYSQEGELGEWQGKGAEALGFTGAVTEAELKNALWGKDKEGEQKVNVRLDDKGDRKRAGLDLPFNAPKSLSVLYEIANATGNTELAKKIVNIFNSSVTDSVNKFEELVQTRKTEDGKTTDYFSGNIAVAKFTHSIARPVKDKETNTTTIDPSLHTHTVIMNMTKAKDGSWKTIETPEIFREYMAIGAQFRIDLAQKLNDELGLDIKITNAQQAFFEVDLKTENDNEIINEFSKRSEQLNDKDLIEKLKTKYPNKPLSEIKRLATYASREWKGEIDRKEVESQNLERAEVFGLDKTKIEEIMSKAKTKLENKTEDKIDYNFLVNKALEIITEQNAVFTKSKLVEISSKIGFKNMPKMDKLDLAISKNRNIIKITDNRYSTKEIINAERYLIDSAQETKKIKQSFLVRDAKQAVEEFSVEKKENTGFGLTDGQKKATVHVLSNTNQIIAIQGDAGVGKTTMLNALNQLKDENTKFIGLSYTGKAANEIEVKTAIKSKEVFEKSGIQSFTIHKFLNTKKLHEKPENQNLKIIVDEASMIGTKQATQLVEIAKQTGAQLVLMGDEKQFKAIGAGDPFALLKDHAGISSVDMREAIRQKNPTLKKLVSEVANYKLDDAFNTLNQNKILNKADDMQELISIYKKNSPNPKDTLGVIGGEDSLMDTVVLTNTNKAKNVLNEAFREINTQKGFVKKETEVEVDIFKNASLSPIASHFVQSYKEKGVTHVRVNSNKNENLPIGDYEVLAFNEKENTLYIKSDKGEGEIDLSKDGLNLVPGIKAKQKFANGDRILFTRNDKKLGVNNGELATIKKIDKEGNLTVKVDEKKEITFNIADYKNIDYGYAITTMKSQGMSAKNVYAWLDAKAQNFNSFYVATSRAVEDLKIWTNDTELLREKVGVKQFEPNATTYLEEVVVQNENKLKSFREKSVRKNNFLKQAQKLNDKLYLQDDSKIKKMTSDELKKYISEKEGEIKKINDKKDGKLEYALNTKHKKLTDPQKENLSTELSKMFMQKSKFEDLVTIWDKLEKVGKLTDKDRLLISNKVKSAKTTSGQNNNVSAIYKVLEAKVETLKSSKKVSEDIVKQICKNIQSGKLQQVHKSLNAFQASLHKEDHKTVLNALKQKSAQLQKAQQNQSNKNIQREVQNLQKKIQER